MFTCFTTALNRSRSGVQLLWIELKMSYSRQWRRWLRDWSWKLMSALTPANANTNNTPSLHSTSNAGNRLHLQCFLPVRIWHIFNRELYMQSIIYTYIIMLNFLDNSYYNTKFIIQKLRSWLLSINYDNIILTLFWH